jgi:hypothetical protein
MNNQNITINTTQLCNLVINHKNLAAYKFYRVIDIDDNDFKRFYSYVRKNYVYLSDYRPERGSTVYFLSTTSIDDEQYSFKKITSENIEDYIILNLLIKAIPYIVSHPHQFCTVDNLARFYDIKEVKSSKKGIIAKEYIAHEVSISKNLVINISVGSYTPKETLLNYYSKQPKKLNAINNKASYYENNGKLIHFSKFNLVKNKLITEKFSEEVLNIVKGKVSISGNNNSLAASTDYRHVEATKDHTMYLFMELTKQIIDLVQFSLTEVKGKFITNEKGSINRNTERDYLDTVKSFFLTHNLSIVDKTSNPNNVEAVYARIDEYLGSVKNTYKTLHDKADCFIVITDDIQDYKEGKASLDKDPYSRTHNLNTQHISLPAAFSTPHLTKIKEGIPVMLKELVIKNNISHNHLNYFSGQNNTLIKYTPLSNDTKDENTTCYSPIEFCGINVHNNDIIYLHQEDSQQILSSLAHNDIFIDTFNELYNNKVPFYIISYGDLTTDKFIYSNVAFITTNEEKSIHISGDLSTHYYNHTPNKTKYIKSRTIKNGGELYPFSGLTNMFYSKVDDYHVNYYIGSVIPSNADVARHATYYNLKFVSGCFSESYFDLFEHYYIKNKDAVTLPYTDKYLREALQYDLIRP